MSATRFIYLIHFDKPFKHARHYIGSAVDLDARLSEHRTQSGARLMAVVNAAGIPWRLARAWRGGRTEERRLKNMGGAARLCPILLSGHKVGRWHSRIPRAAHREGACAVMTPNRMSCCPTCGQPAVPKPVMRFEPVEREALRAIAKDLEGCREDLWRFFSAVFLTENAPKSVKDLANMLGVSPVTLTSRFQRAGLPSPKKYLLWAKLVRAARALENESRSIVQVAEIDLREPSAQGFGRSIRLALGVTARQFRRETNGAAMIERYRAELILPHVAVLRDFAPLLARAA